MKSKIYFLLLCLAVIAPTVVLGLATQRPEIAVCCLLPETALLILVYRMLFRPMRVIATGLELLREQDFSSRLRKVGQPDADRVVDMFNSMMACLHRQNLQIREQNEFLDLLIDASPMGVIILDDNDNICQLNGAACEMLATGAGTQPLSALTSPLALALRRLGRDEVRTVRLANSEVFRCSRLHFMDRGWHHPFMLIERLTDEVRAAEKQAFARVIRTMAHEVNNSMAAIISTMSTSRTILADHPRAANLLEPVNACLTRSAELTGFVRRFAEVVKVPEPILCLTDFMELILSALPILESICSACGARLETDLTNAAPVRMDPVLMQQALVNIVKNAAESASRGGTVTLRADGHTLLVIDNGPGLTPDSADNLFSALYTTKPDGHGLGLLLVAEILNKHSARFSLQTTPPLTTFSITLP